MTTIKEINVKTQKGKNKEEKSENITLNLRIFYSSYHRMNRKIPYFVHSKSYRI